MMNRSRRGRHWVTATVIIAAAVWVTPQVASAETVPLPAGASTAVPAPGNIEAISCPSAGACVAGGDYYDTATDQQALAETETGGVWTATKVNLSGVSPNSDPFAELQQISCPAAGSCVAVGDYEDSSHTQQGMIVTQSGGTWTVAKVALPSGAAPNPQVEFDGLTCASVGNCVAVGFYGDGAGEQQGLVLSETNGSWTSSKVSLSGLSVSATNPDVLLTAVSCPDAGDCVAVGSYWDTSNHSQDLMLSDTNGTWTAHKADLSKLPSVASNPYAYLSAVSCPSTGNCIAVGTYSDGSSRTQALAVGESAGTWSPAGKVTLPSNADTVGANSDTALNAVSCSSAGNCAAVGSYDATSLNEVEGLEVTETGGVWSSGLEASLPVAGATNPYLRLDTVTCSTGGSCLAGGGYVSSGGAYEELVLNYSSGTWTGAATAVLSHAQATLGGAHIACSQSDYCAVAGDTPSGGIAGVSPFLLDAPAAVATPSASVSIAGATVTWGAPADDGGFPPSGYTVTASDLTDSARGGQAVTATGSTTSATFSGLTAGDTYTFTVTPASPLGAGLPATSASVALPPSKQQISASLAGLLAPKGPGSRLAKLHRTSGYTFTYHPLESGKVAVRWYETTGKGKHRKKHLLASGSAATNGTATTKLKVRLTAFGRRAVKAAHKLRLSATVTFTSGSTTVTQTHTFTLH
jgi:hypothetical protein